MQDPTALHLRRICRNFVIIVSQYFWVNVAPEKLFRLFRLHKHQIQKIDETFFEFLQKLASIELMFKDDVMEGFEEISFAYSCDHLRLEDSFVELKVYFLRQRADVPDVDAVLVE